MPSIHLRSFFHLLFHVALGFFDLKKHSHDPMLALNLFVQFQVPSQL